MFRLSRTGKELKGEKRKLRVHNASLSNELALQHNPLRRQELLLSMKGRFIPVSRSFAATPDLAMLFSVSLRLPPPPPATAYKW